MTRGRNLSYWQEEMKDSKHQTILLARNTAKDVWMVVGIYASSKADDIRRTTYANWPEDCFEMIDLP